MNPQGRGGADPDTRTAVASRLLASPQVRVGTLLPTVLGVLYVVVAGEIERPGLFVACAVTAGVLGGVTGLRLYPGDPVTDPRAQRFADAWQLVSAVGGVALAVPFFLAVAVDVEVLAGIFGLTLVIGAYVFPRGRRMPLLGWITLVWLVVLVTNGYGQPAVLAVHMAGAGLLTGLGCLQEEHLARRLAAAIEERHAAEQRTRLLASVLRTNTLDPDEVLEETAHGLIDVGFDFAAIRMLDHEAQVGRLVVQASVFDVDLPPVLEFGAGEFGRVVASRRPRLVRWAYRDPANFGHNPLRDLYVLPLMLDDEVAATVSVATSRRPITAAHTAAAELLAEQASSAFFRARAYRADARIVAELQRLEVTTREYVTAVSHELRTPLTVVSGIGDTLRRRWDDLEPDERRQLIARARRGTERLSEAVQALSRPPAADPRQLIVQTEAVALRRSIADRVRRFGPSWAEERLHLDVPDSLQVHVDRVLFHYLVDEVLAHTAGAVEVAEPAWHGAAVDAELELEVVARRLGDRVVVTVALGTTRDSRPSGSSGDGLARAARLSAGLSLAEEVVEAHGGQLTATGQSVSFDVPA